MELPDTSQKEHLCPYVWKIQSQSSLNTTKDAGGAEVCTARVSTVQVRWMVCELQGETQHLFLAINPLSSGLHEESFFHLRHLCYSTS